MATLVRRASEGERTLLTKRPRGVVHAVAPAAGDKKMARDKFARHAVTTPPPPKRSCRGFDVKIREEGFSIEKVSAIHESASERLKQRMEAERDALGILLKKAALLAFLAGKHDARIVAAKVETTKQSTEPKMQSTEPKKRQPAAPRTTKGSMANRIDQAKEAMKKRRQEEIARAREKFRQDLLELEKAAMPDETIYLEDLEELGIAAFQYDVTRTRKQSPLGSRWPAAAVMSTEHDFGRIVVQL